MIAPTRTRYSNRGSWVKLAVRCWSLPGSQCSLGSASRPILRASGHAGLLARPPGLGAIGPKAVQDDGQLAGHRDPRLAPACALGQAHVPGLQR
jgi:hypothetical protein